MPTLAQRALPSMGLGLCLVATACGVADEGGPQDAADGAPEQAAADGGGQDAGGAPGGAIKVVFVIAMENRDDTEIYGDPDAPYINGTLMPTSARAVAFHDELPTLDSEPHYVWMEAGTNAFYDRTFVSDDPPSAANSTGSADHLVRQLGDAGDRATWRAYQEGLDATSGACPIASSGFYHPKHDPFVFFRDVSGSPPSKDNPFCAAHHSPLAALSGDLAAGAVATYNFITPDQCHDMHGQSGCPAGSAVRAGDDWLAATMPALIAYVEAHEGVVFIVWDEGNASKTVPFLAVGPHVKPGYAGGGLYDHSALVKSLALILGVPPLPAVASAPDLSDLFLPGGFP